MNIGPQYQDVCVVTEDVPDPVTATTTTTADNNQELEKPAAISASASPHDDDFTKHPPKKASRKIIPHIKSIGKSLSLDARTFRSKFKESKSVRESDMPSSAPPSEGKVKAKSFHFKFPSPERKKQPVATPDTPPPLYDGDDATDESKNNSPPTNSHSKSKLRTSASSKNRKKVKFN